MKREIKKQVINAVKSNLNRSELIRLLEPNLSDLELGSAIRYFDKLTLNQTKIKRYSFIELLKLPLHILKIFLLMTLFYLLKLSFAFRRLFLNGSQEVSFNDFEKSFNMGRWFSDKSPSQKTYFILSFLSIFILVFFFFYVNFIHYKECTNQSCFQEMVFSCNRATFESDGLISLNNKIIGVSFRGCKVKVESLDNELNIPPGEEMVCYLPLGLRVLPQNKIEYCSGELREDIQDLIISELYKVVGQNVGDINSFFKN